MKKQGFFKNHKGQTLVEYGAVAALFIVVLIFSINPLERAFGGKYFGMGNDVSKLKYGPESQGVIGSNQDSVWHQVDDPGGASEKTYTMDSSTNNTNFTANK